MVKQFKFVFLIEYGFMLPSPLPVIAADADVSIAIKGFQHVLQLVIKHLLGTKNDWIHEVHLVADHLAAFGPHVALHTVVPILVTDVVRAHEHLLGRKRKGNRKQKGGN